MREGEIMRDLDSRYYGAVSCGVADIKSAFHFAIVLRKYEDASSLINANENDKIPFKLLEEARETVKKRLAASTYIAEEEKNLGKSDEDIFAAEFKRNAEYEMHNFLDINIKKRSASKLPQ